MNVLSCPSVPFWGHIPDGVHPGTVIHIDGHVPHHSEGFSLNLVHGHDVGHHAEHHSSISLHFNPRIHENLVVVNSRHHSSWGNEERFHHVHAFRHGSNFNVTIFVESQFYRVVVNGNQFCTFPHRMSFHEVKTLFINSHVDIHRIEYRREYSAPYPQQPYAPATAYIPPTVYVPPTVVYEEHGHHHHHHDGHHHHHRHGGHKHHDHHHH